LVLTVPDVSIRSASGDRDKVILDGKKGRGTLVRAGCVNEIIAVKASNTWSFLLPPS